MHDALKALLIVGAVVGSVVGCRHYNSEQEKSAAVARGKRAVAEHTYKAKLSAPPASRVLQVGNNQIVVIDMTLESGLGPTLAAGQRCYVWRDAEYKTASLSCPQEESLKSIEE